MKAMRAIRQAQEHLRDNGVSGWLLYDYRGMNPIFWETIGPIANVTRPCWLWVPARGEPRLLVGFVDQGRFQHLGIETALWSSRSEMVEALGDVLSQADTVAMEYSPEEALPRVSRVDGGTVELVRSLRVEVVSSGDVVQYATQRWSDDELASHRRAAEALSSIVREAFEYVGLHLSSGVTEYDVAEFIRERFRDEGLESPDGPVVAVNDHSADPHYDPGPESSAITPGHWLLIDLWAREPAADAMYADITWTAYVGDTVPKENQRVFDAVLGARDAALDEIETAFTGTRQLRGWEVDKVARDFIADAGYGDYFGHRLGHSLGREVHGNAVNLDSWETYDTRSLLAGLAVTIEPGIYLPGKFGVRSEIDVYISEEGPEVTTDVQREVVLIA